MAAIEISAKRKEDSAAVTATYDFGDSLQEAVDKFGADVVFVGFKQNAVIGVQSVMRRWLAADPEKRGDLQALVSEWRPDARTVVRQSAEEKAKTAIQNMSPEQRAALLQQLREAGLV